MTQKSAAKERSAAAAVGLREGAFLGGMFLFVKKLFVCVWQLETLFLCIFTLTFLLLVVVVIKTNLFCVFRQRIVVCK